MCVEIMRTDDGRCAYVAGSRSASISRRGSTRVVRSTAMDDARAVYVDISPLRSSVAAAPIVWRSTKKFVDGASGVLVRFALETPPNPIPRRESPRDE